MEHQRKKSTPEYTPNSIDPIGACLDRISELESIINQLENYAQDQVNQHIENPQRRPRETVRIWARLVSAAQNPFRRRLAEIMQQVGDFGYFLGNFSIYARLTNFINPATADDEKE